MSAEAAKGAVEAAWFSLGRDFTFTGPHDRVTAHAIVAEHRPRIEAALRATPVADTAGPESERDAITRDRIWASGYSAGRAAASRALADTAGIDAALMAALADVTAAYHHERQHEGHWSHCQHPRCQNARLATEGRGPFAAALRTPKPEGDR